MTEPKAGLVRVTRMVAWAPDGRSLAMLRYNGQIDIWDIATDRKTRTLAGGRIPIRGAASLGWSPDGRYFFYLATGGRLAAFDTATSRPFAVSSGDGNRYVIIGVG